MKQLVVFGLSLTLTVAQLLPFCILPTSLFLKMVNIEKSIENSGNIVENEMKDNEIIEPDKEVVNIITPNYILELEGYCTFGFHSSYFSLIDSLSTNGKKTIRYKDNKSKITASYVTDLKPDMDIPGYITKEIADVNTVTNDKYTLDVFDNKWMVVPAKEKINNMNTYVHYLLSNNNTSAFWMRVDVTPESDTDEFRDNIIFRMLESVNIYYIGGTVFETPTGGYYADKEMDNNSGQNQDNYGANNDKNTVYDNNSGVVKADIANNWDSLEVIINNKKIKLPCAVSELLEAGFYIDDSSNINENSEIVAGTSVNITATNNSNAYFNIRVTNNSNSKANKIKDCTISYMDINLSEFKYTENVGDDYIILPSGITTKVYVDNLVKLWGSYYKSESIQGSEGLTKIYTWKSGNKMIKLYTGVLSGITRIEIDSNN